ncbi:hypothetical protein PENTCL1PPCAC_11564 [Pristionchus entomophagus]|uniref:Uncharacterized protein n=1 Tax=Pristionchus entomophagus TaxID=358040 RepID=A0AAV5T2A7_9BILA|nr:hypothetical protein PENTCL1PPCAC_11564 [Pristionchus entomophagus]
MSSEEVQTPSPDASPVPERPSSKKCRYEGDSSSEDDDYYSNFDKMLERNNKAFQKGVPKNDPIATKEASPRLISSSDSESDIEEVKEENTLEMLLKKGKKFNEDREKKITAEMDKIKQLAQVGEAEEGAQPDMMYRDPHSKEAESRLRQLKEDRRAAFARRSQDFVDLIVLDNCGERTEKEYASHGRHTLSRKGPKVTFLLQDLHKNDTRIEKMNAESPFRSLVDGIVKRWNCKETEVVLTIEGGVSVTDLSLSPMELNVSLEGIHTISAIFVPVKKAGPISTPAVARDPNMISIKFQSGEGKPTIIEMNKVANLYQMGNCEDTPFSEIVGQVAEGLKMATVGRMVFDCEKVDFSWTPIDLDMDDGDCMDVYAA